MVRPTIDLQDAHFFNDLGQGRVVKLLSVVGLNNARRTIPVHHVEEKTANLCSRLTFYRPSHCEPRIAVDNVAGVVEPMALRQLLEVHLPATVRIGRLDRPSCQGGLRNRCLPQTKLTPDVLLEQYLDRFPNDRVQVLPKSLVDGLKLTVIASMAFLYLSDQLVFFLRIYGDPRRPPKICKRPRCPLHSRNSSPEHALHVFLKCQNRAQRQYGAHPMFCLRPSLDKPSRYRRTSARNARPRGLLSCSQFVCIFQRRESPPQESTAIGPVTP